MSLFFTRSPGESFRLENCLGEPFATITLIDHRGRLKVLPRKMTHVRLDTAKGDKVVPPKLDAASIAERIYTGHGAACGWIGRDGLPVPEWSELEPRERTWWEIAAREVIDAICEQGGNTNRR